MSGTNVVRGIIDEQLVDCRVVGGTGEDGRKMRTWPHIFVTVRQHHQSSGVLPLKSHELFRLVSTRHVIH